MKKIAQFNTQTQAHIFSQTLLNQGIKSEIIGAREYSSIIVGGDLGKYELLVDWQDESEALRILKEIESKTIPLAEHVLPTAGALFKKSVVFALLACVFIPVVLNYASLKAWWQYWNTEVNPKRKILATVFIFALQLPPFIFTYYFFQNLPNYTDIDSF
ncbi:MAG: DUF2007 domain-containing protein [Bdellovibrionaceae bacterium]|nr:DUF2007 domain-containing protein [Pseudobdellovibrionaceae bacterium]